MIQITMNNVTFRPLMDHATISSTTDNATTSSKTNGQIDNTSKIRHLWDNSTVSSPTNQGIILSPTGKCNYPLPWTIQQSVHPWTMQLLYLLTNRWVDKKVRLREKSAYLWEPSLVRSDVDDCAVHLLDANVHLMDCHFTLLHLLH